MAERAGISPDAVGALERGFRKAPYRDTVERLARALGLGAADHAALAASVRRVRGAPADVPVAFAVEHNLPREMTSFLGRERVVAEIEELVLANSLVTIVGTGGAGKTRTAIRVGTAALSHFRDGVWLVELAALTESSAVVSAIAATLGVQESSSRALHDSVSAHLKRKRALLIFDNCEHVVEGAASAAHSILQCCPDVRVLATSREPLDVGGEHVYRLPALSFPEREDVCTETDAKKYEAVSLFVDRARAVNRDFRLGTDTAVPVAEICRRLDGLPLAIELAAARVRTMTPSELVHRLNERFSVLAGADRTALPRQRTMRALIDWSYDLLSDPERLLFERLGIFPSSFTLEAAIGVCSDSDLAPSAIEDVLYSLVDKSLVVADGEGESTRYRLLESTRDYAAERLAQRGELARFAERHARTFLEIAEDLEQRWYDEADIDWSARSERELDNFRAALEWARSAPGGEAVFVRLVAALSRVWYSFQPAEGGRSVAMAMERVDGSTDISVLARLAVAEAEFHESRAQFKAALTAAERAVEQFSATTNALGMARAQHLLGSALVGLGRIEDGEAALHEALSAARSLRSPRLVSVTFGALGGARNRRGDFAGAKEFYAEALAYQRRHGFERQAASVAGNLAEVEFGMGDVEKALRHAHSALETHIALRNRRAVAIDLFNMSAYFVAADRFEEASAAALQALDAAGELQARIFALWALQHLAAVCALHPVEDNVRKSERERAAGLLGYVDAQLEELSAVREYTERQEYERVKAALDAELEKSEFARAYALGREWSEERAFAEATETGDRRFGNRARPS